MWSKELTAFRAASLVAQSLPAPAAYWLGCRTGYVVGRVPDRDGRRALVASHMARVTSCGPSDAARLVPEVFANYGRYWVESLRLPCVPSAEVIASVTTEGEEHVDAGLAAGNGVIIAAPHLGGWEWGARYLVARGVRVTVAVESLQPPDLFDWFVSFRRRLGMNVVPVGPAAPGAILQALRDNHVVCLLSDRLVGTSSGVETTFFGSSTTMPAGPVTLAVRSRAPIVAAAIYFGRQADAHHIVFRPPLDLPSSGGLRQVVRGGTQGLAAELEGLIRRAPAQWHLVQPNWPDDPPLRRAARGA